LKALSIPLRIYQTSGIETLVKKTGILSKFPRLAGLATLSPRVQSPSFFAQYGKTFAPEGERRYRVAMLGGCMANVCFARLHEATVRVLQWNGCEVVVPPNQTCCGALHLHAGRKKEAQRLARQNVDALLDGGFDAIITNTAGCGCALKEYHELLEDAPAYAERAHAFSGKVKDVSEFLNSIGFRPPTREVNALVTYQDSCHLTHGQKLPGPPRKLLQSIPGIRFREMPFSDHCCGSAGIYNVLHTDMSMRLLRKKMANANSTEAEIITSANPGCLLQLEAGVRLHGNGQRVMHVIELLDEAYGGKEGLPQA
jgi:glycolate oxidase iron-sulfur subunit